MSQDDMIKLLQRFPGGVPQSELVTLGEHHMIMQLLKKDMIRREIVPDDHPVNFDKRHKCGNRKKFIVFLKESNQ